MPLSPTEAADALRDIDQTQQHSAALRGYQVASPYLILWGFVWLIGYSLSYARPQWTLTWAILSLIGAVGSFILGMRPRKRNPGEARWQYVATFLAIFLFIAALFYSLVGIWSHGHRILITGVAIAALTLFGFFYLPAYFMLWMAVVGGGGLILGGFWLRSV